MSLVVEEPYPNGVPQTAVDGFDPAGLAWHWTAGATGRAGAESVIRGFIATRATVNASYHVLVFREGAKTVAMFIVPVARAAHSIAPSQVYQINPNKPTALQNARFAEVRRILGAKATDPNAACIAISFCGMPADLEAARKDPAFMADIRELARRMKGYVNDPRPHFGHGWIQPISRYELDISVDFVAELYGAAAPPIAIDPEELMTRAWKPYTVTWDTVPGGSFTVAGTNKQFAESVEVTTFLESIEIVDGEVRTPMDRVLLANYPDPVAGPEVLVIPRSTLVNPRNGGPGLRLGGTLTSDELARIQKAASEAGFIAGRNAAAAAAGKVSPPA